MTKKEEMLRMKLRMIVDWIEDADDRLEDLRRFHESVEAELAGVS